MRVAGVFKPGAVLGSHVVGIGYGFRDFLDDRVEFGGILVPFGDFSCYERHSWRPEFGAEAVRNGFQFVEIAVRIAAVRLSLRIAFKSPYFKACCARSTASS